MLKEGSQTPWGPAQSVSELAPGIYVVDTAGHGGIKLDRRRQLSLPMGVRREGGWYEEDCEAVIPLVAFFDELHPGDEARRSRLIDSLACWNPNDLEVLRGRGLVK